MTTIKLPTKKPKRKNLSTIESCGYGAYTVVCGNCRESYDITIYPESCAMCGKKLEVLK